MTPYDKFMQEKRAFFGKGPAASVVEQMPAMLLQAAGTAAGAATVAGIGYAAREAYNALTKKRDFNNMLSANPDLKEMHSQDPKQFNLMFTSLRNMNPTFSKDPIVAGTFMRRMVDSPMTAGGVAVEALRAEVPSPVSNVFFQGAHSGAQQAFSKRELPWETQLSREKSLAEARSSADMNARATERQMPLGKAERDRLVGQAHAMQYGRGRADHSLRKQPLTKSELDRLRQEAYQQARGRFEETLDRGP